MKTFEQYINEVRHNYIFGGTDNRNTDVEFTKSLYQLEKGDTVYYYSDLFDSLESMTFERFQKWPDECELICMCKGNDGKSHEKTIYLDDKKLRYVVAVNNDSVVGTNAKLFIDAINKNFKNFKYAEDDIFDGRVNEAKQNYIFGGTDDRNTDIATDAKKFNELDSGDIVYYVSVSEFGNKVVEAKVIYHNAEWLKFKTSKRKVVWDWDPVDYETKSIVYNDYSGKLFALSTSKELIEELLEQYMNK